MGREADFGGIMSETFALLSDTVRYVVIYVLVVGGVNGLAIALGLAQASNRFASIGGGFTTNPEVGLLGNLFVLVGAIVAVIAGYLLITKLLEARGLLPDPSTRIWAYVGMSILSVLGIIFGFLLLIVPGIVLLVRWSAASGYLIGARTGVIDALSASWDATRGYSWPIFFVGLVLLIGMAVLGGVFGGIAAFGSALGAIGVVSSFVDAMSNALFLAFGIAVYVLLGTNEREIGEVFS